MKKKILIFLLLLLIGTLISCGDSNEESSIIAFEPSFEFEKKDIINCPIFSTVYYNEFKNKKNIYDIIEIKKDIINSKKFIENVGLETKNCNEFTISKDDGYYYILSETEKSWAYMDNICDYFTQDFKEMLDQVESGNKNVKELVEVYGDTIVTAVIKYKYVSAVVDVDIKNNDSDLESYVKYCLLDEGIDEGQQALLDKLLSKSKVRVIYQGMYSYNTYEEFYQGTFVNKDIYDETYYTYPQEVFKLSEILAGNYNNTCKQLKELEE